MRRFIFIGILSFILSSCSTQYIVSESYKMDEVEVSGAIVADVSNGVYSDDALSMIATMDGTGIQFELRNNSNGSIKINWDDGSYIDSEGMAHRVIHAGTKYIDKEKPQVPTVIPRDSYIAEMAAPSDAIDWDSKQGSWSVSSISSDMGVFDTQEAANACISQMSPKKLLLPIEINGKVEEYLFIFTQEDGMVKSVSRMSKAGRVLTLVAALALAMVLLGSS